MTQWPEVQELASKGHTIEPLDLSRYHAVFQPNAHFMLIEMARYIDISIKSIQQRLNREKKAAKGAKRAN